MTVNEDECAAAGIDTRKVASIARRLERAARDAEAIGLTVFGGTGSGDLRFDDGGRGCLILANISGPWDGGDGGCTLDPGGLLRGETE